MPRQLTLQQIHSTYIETVYVHLGDYNYLPQQAFISKKISEGYSIGTNVLLYIWNT